MKQAIPSALISTDPEFRTMLTRVLTEARCETSIGVDIKVPFMEIKTEHLDQLKQVRPELIFLDLEQEPEVGIQFAQYLADAQPSRRFIAVGPVLTPELLMMAMRAGITEYLTKPVTPEALIDTLNRTERRLGVAAGGVREPGKVITFFGARGGSGSTTVATNTAIQLHKLTGKRVLLVDLDLELGEVALFLRVQPRFSVVDLARNLYRMDAELLTSYIESHPSGVHLLAAPYHPEKVEAVTADQAREILNLLRQHYDYLVVDTARSFTSLTQVALQQAEEIFLVTQMDLPSLRNIKRSLPLMERIGGTLDKIRLVVNRYDAECDITIEETKRTLGLEVYRTLANDFEHVMRSINSGEPVVLNGNGSAFVRDLKAFSSALTGIPIETNGRRNALDSVRQLFRRSPTEKEAAVNG